MSKATQNGGNSNNAQVTTKQTLLTAEEMVNLPLEELMDRLHVSPNGLNSEQATERLETYGSNELSHEHRHSVPQALL